MKTLLTLINEYRVNPTESLQNIIWKFIMNEDNGHYFANIDAYNDEGDWIEYGENLRVKKIQPHTFVATEVVKNTFSGYFCLFHLVKLSDYSEIQIEEYKDNYPEYKDIFISGQDALLKADNRSILIVVDTNRREIIRQLNDIFA